MHAPERNANPRSMAVLCPLFLPLSGVKWRPMTRPIEARAPSRPKFQKRPLTFKGPI